MDAWQPWENLKGTCGESLSSLPRACGLPEDLFHKGSHLLPLHIPKEPILPPEATAVSAHAQLFVR